MKIMHLGDLHIGKSLGDFDLYEDQKYILEQILNLIKEKSVDVLLIAGDVYDKAIPGEKSVQLLDYFLKRLVETGIKTYMISGNHDSDERLNFGSSLFESNNIYINSKFNGILKRYSLYDEFGELNIYLLPFVKASQVQHFFPEEKIDSYDMAVRTIIKHSDFDACKRNILVAHQFVAGKDDPEIAGSEGLSVHNVGMVEKIGYGSLAEFDYVALGHIHSPQSVGLKHIRYCGSPIKYSLSEVNNNKSVPIITFKDKGEVLVEFAPLLPMRDIRHLRGNIKNLLDKKNISMENDFIYATLTDEDIVNDAMGIFREYYPNTVKIDYDNSHTKEIENVDITRITQNKTFDELIKDFYMQMYSCDMGEEELEIMKWAAKEAGVGNEAD
ncbi:MAG: exonuclease SbcCD subunit D [Lachnospiraceae bacterium]|nr:MAG: exonuclease SbcCD subunit D [Lachnospiraceae bacterium]